MKQLFPLLLGLFLFRSTAPADVLLLRNGDRISGTLEKRENGQVFFRSDLLGRLTLPEEKVASVETEPAPTVAAHEKAAPRKAAVPPPPKSTIAKKKKKKAWSAQAGLAVAMREKNSTRVRNDRLIETYDKYETYRLYGNIRWQGIQDSIAWKWLYRYSKDETRKRDDFFNVTQTYNHVFDSTPYYAEAKTLYQRDYNRQIEHEYLQTAEIGRKWFDHPRISFSTSVGAGYHWFERSIDGSDIQTGEPKFIFDENFRWQVLQSLTLFQQYTHLGDFERYHFVFSGGLENKLVRNLFLRLEYRVDRDTEIDYDDNSYFDKALLTSLLYKF